MRQCHADAIAGASVNRVSSMSADRFCTACLTVARAGAAGALRPTSTPLTRASTVIYNPTANNRKLTKHYIKV